MKKKNKHSRNSGRQIEADNYRQGQVMDGRRRRRSRSGRGQRATDRNSRDYDRNQRRGMSEADIRRVREERTDMPISEMQRRRRRRRQKEIARKKRRFYSIVLMVILVLIAVVVLANQKKRTEGEIDNFVEEAKAPRRVQEDTEVTSGYNGSEIADMAFVTGEYPGAVDISELLTPGAALDTTRGQAAVDLSKVETNMGKVQSAKAAMKQKSYFVGTSQTVDSYLQAYGAGEWFGIMDVSGDVCVFYEGKKEEKITTGNLDEDISVATVENTFKIVFVVYEDGSFSVQQISVNDSLVDDYQTFLNNIVNG